MSKIFDKISVTNINGSVLQNASSKFILEDNSTAQSIKTDLSIDILNGFSTSQVTNGLWSLTSTLPVSAVWNVTCWSDTLQLFCSVGTNSSIVVSTNGINWTNVSYTSGQLYRTICWSHELGIFVIAAAVSTTTIFITSTDGFTWTEQSPISSVSVRSLCWSKELGIFCGVATTTKSVTSSDGINWTVTTPTAVATGINVCWANTLGLFVSINGGSTRVITSPDGINWTGRSAQNASWNQVCWSPDLGLLVAVAINAFLMISSDGINWSTQSSNLSDSIYSVCWAHEISLFVAVAANVQSQFNIITSQDGINWVAVNQSDSGNLGTICWSPQLYIFVAFNREGSNYFFTSPSALVYLSGGHLTVAKTLNFTGSVHPLINYNSQNRLTFGETFPLPNDTGTVVQYGSGSSSRNMIFAFAKTGVRTGFLGMDGTNVIFGSESSGVIIRNNFDYSNTDVLASGTTLATFDSNGLTIANYLNFSGTSHPLVNFNPQHRLTFGESSPLANETGSVAQFSSGLNTRNMLITFSKTGVKTGFLGMDGSNIILGCDNTGALIFTNNLDPNSSNVLASGTNILSISSSGITAPLITFNDSTDITKQLSFQMSSAITNTKLIVSSAQIANRIITIPDSGRFSSTFILKDASSTQTINSSLTIAKNLATSNTLALSYGSSTLITGGTWIDTGTIPNVGWGGVCWSHELSLFCAVGNASPYIITSPDGITWTSMSINPGGFLSDICWSPQKTLFVACNGGNSTFVTSNDGINWTNRNVGNTGFQSICWSSDLGIFCTCGAVSPYIMTSSDGITWNSQSAPSNAYDGICWANTLGLFVAVGTSSSYVITSPDGVNWTTRTAPGDNWKGVCWAHNLGLLVAVNSSASGTDNIITSPDGITWTTQTSGNSNNQYGRVAWAEEISLLVTAGSVGGNFQTLLTSPDGINWTNRTASNFNSYYSVAWSPDLGIFVALTNSGTNGTYSASAAIFTSVPGTLTITGASTLSTTTIADPTDSTKKITFQSSGATASTTLTLASAQTTNQTITIPDAGKNSSFILQDSLATQNIKSNLGLSGTISISNPTGSALRTAVLGASWNNTNTIINRSYTSMCWSHELLLFCAISANGSGHQAYTSPDGYTWTQQVTPVVGANWLSICWGAGAGVFVAVAPNGSSQVMTSSDGITWTSRTSASNDIWESVCWSQDLTLFCAVGSSVIMTSPDGITWTSQSGALTSGWNGICWSSGLGLFVAVAPSGSTQVITSPDGINWTGRTAASSDQWVSVCWAPEINLLCAVEVASSGTAHGVMTSPDGINWTLRSTPVSGDGGSEFYVAWTTVCWATDLGLFLAVSDTGFASSNAIVSADGITWSNKVLPITQPYLTVCWSEDLGIFCALPDQNTQGFVSISSLSFTSNFTNNGTSILSTTTIGDSTDSTKKITFQSSGATTATTLTLASAQTTNRTITFPNATDTLVARSTVDTLMNKTLQGISYGILSTTATSLTLDNTYYLIRINAASTCTLTIPLAATYPGQAYLIFNVSTNVVNIVRSGSDTFSDGTITSESLPDQYDRIKMVSDGVSIWLVI